MDKEALINHIRTEAMKEAIYTFGTGYIFGKQADRYRSMIRGLAWLGIGIPLVVGIVYINFRTKQNLLEILLVVAGVLGVVQVVLSAIALVYKWEDGYSYSLESKIRNYALAGQFRRLAISPSPQATEFERQFELLQKENELRNEQDHKQNVSEKELRMGMRAALREYQRSCVGCGEIPQSMKSTKCPVCGNF